MGQFSNSFPKHFSYLCEYAIRFDLSCSFCEYPFIFHCLHCSPSCFDPDSLLLAYLWLGLSWIDCISATKSLSSSKTSSGKPYTSSKQQERHKHSVEITINFSDTSQPKQPNIGDAREFMKLINEMFAPALANVSVNTKNAYYPFGHIVPSESPHWAYCRFDWELQSCFPDKIIFKVRECAQFLTGQLIVMDMHALSSTEVYRAVIARDRKELNKGLQAPKMLAIVIANLPGRGGVMRLARVGK